MQKTTNNMSDMNIYTRMGDPEHTRFTHTDFPFNIFNIRNATTISHWHNHMEIVLIHEGNQVVGINGEEVLCHPGDMVLIAPGCLHTIKCTQGHYSATVVGDALLKEVALDIDLNHIIRQFMSDPVFDYLVFGKDSRDFKSVRVSMNQLRNEYVTRQEGYKTAIKLELGRLMLSVIREGLLDTYIHESDTRKSYKEGNTSVSYIKRAIAYIEDHHREKISLEDMSQLTNLSKQHFARLFKTYTGKTLVEYLTLFRLDMSNWYLKHTDLPITQIPEQVGFCNANYYARLYKRQYGMSPRDTRRI